MALTKEGCAMPKESKKYVVGLTDAERETLRQIVGKFKGNSQKVRPAQILLKADADGPDWTDAKVAEAFGCRTQTVENIRERFVTQGFELTLNGQGSAGTAANALCVSGESDLGLRQSQHAHERGFLRSVRAGEGEANRPPAGVPPHAQARQLAEHRRK